MPRSFQIVTSVLSVAGVIWVSLCLLLAPLACLSKMEGSPILQEAKSQQQWLTGIRRHLHQWPELMYEQWNTSLFIREQLDKLGVPYIYPIASTGIVADIGSGSPIVGLRADMDALPIQEQSDVPFRSKEPGRMHACGHDSHVTMLLGAAKLLKAHEKELHGTVKLFFQPAEEGGAGGDRMIKEGSTKDVAAMFGMHIWPTLQAGKIGSRSGAFMGGAQQFNVVVRGRGMHAAMPDLGNDPIVAAVHTIAALQLLVSRETPPAGSAVISVTKIHAGEGAYNVIPDTATFGGTIRSLSHQHIEKLRKRFAEVVEHQTAALSCSGEVDWMQELQPYYPPTVNDPGAFAFAAEVGRRLLGDASLVDDSFDPTMGGEDFAFFGQAGIPSSYMFLGTRNEELGAVHSLHSANFKLDESVMPIGAAYHAALAMEYLASNRQRTAQDEL